LFMQTLCGSPCLSAQTYFNKASLDFAQQRYFLNTYLGLKVNGS